ncbi:MAG TPA: SRPBCC family protein [Candidatus Angelobacter sp.]|nr:SRPBCC family protein [Candidatus Angelobacter sp.]
MTGLIGLGDEVEWQARHFGLWLRMRVRITAFNPHTYFQDTMVKGPFRQFQHNHSFTEKNGGTQMVDRLAFQSPVPPLGKLIDILLLQNHLQRFLETRNQIIKSAAESELWRKYLSSPKS